MSDYQDSNLQNNSELVLCIEEYDDDKNHNIIDTRLFIFWDEMSSSYVIAGKRKGLELVPYVFHCNDTTAVITFVQLTIGNRPCSMMYYNYNTLFEQKEITYEYFEDNMDDNYEIIGYDRININYKKLKNTLSSFKRIFGAKN